MKNTLSSLALAAMLATPLAAFAADNNPTESSDGVKAAVADAAITTAVKGKFLADEHVNGLGITVTTVNGKVTLSGKVPSEDVKKRAESIATNTNGVTEVDGSGLEVTSSMDAKMESKMTDAKMDAKKAAPMKS